LAGCSSDSCLKNNGSDLGNAGCGNSGDIQRRLEIGYNKAARLIERMEDEGVISKPNHQGKREVLLPDHGED
jgi:predicted transcriptional regulator